MPLKKNISVVQKIILLLVLLLLPIAVYAPLFLAVMLPVITLFFAADQFMRKNQVFRPNGTLIIFLFGLIVTSALSSLWAYDPELVIEKLPRTTITVLTGMLLLTLVSNCNADFRLTISNVLVFGIGLAVVLILIERLADGLIFAGPERPVGKVAFMNQFNRPLLILSILIWPAAILLGRRHLFFAIFSVSGLFLINLWFDTNAARFAIAVGSLSFLFVYIGAKRAGIILSIMLAGGIIFSPAIERALPAPQKLFSSLNLPRSAYHRLLVWNFTTDKILQKPILGWGFNNSREIPGGKSNLDESEAALPLHPHNAALQWWLELGVVGALIGAGIVLLATESARRKVHGRLEKACVAGTIASAYTVSMLSFGIWQTWWVSFLFLATGLTMLLCAPRPDQTKPKLKTTVK